MFVGLSAISSFQLLDCCLIPALKLSLFFPLVSCSADLSSGAVLFLCVDTSSYTELFSGADMSSDADLLSGADMSSI